MHTPPLPSMAEGSVPIHRDTKSGGLKTAATATPIRSGPLQNPATAGTPPLQPESRAPSPETRTPSPESRLMLRIKTRWSSAIQEACRYSSIPEEFLAALIANESGGNPEAQRFERGVFRKLCAVRAGELREYGGITRDFLASTEDATLRDWATSWGLTQVLGYHIARRPGGVEILKVPASHLKFALGLLGEFIERFQLNPKAEFEEMFRCWNSGAPYDDPKTPRIEGKTFDPKYAENGLARMEIYRGLGTRDTGLGKEAAG